ncbi:MAG: hypothetical protein AB7E84_05995 [Xanthobacteraceae bacterium]
MFALDICDPLQPLNIEASNAALAHHDGKVDTDSDLSETGLQNPNDYGITRLMAG